MEPIISPWLFYWIGTLDGVVVFLLLLSVVSAAAAAFATASVADDELSKKWLLSCFAPAIFFAAFVLCPTEKVMYRMLIASHTTPQNIEKVIELADKLKDGIKQDVIDVIKETKEK